MITFADLTEPAAAGAERCVDRQLWLACAGGMCTVPPVGASVYYFPQGHAEHALGLAGAPDLSAARVPALVPCRVAAVRYMADPDTDEVFARIRLVPLRAGEADLGGLEDGDAAAAADEQEKPASFAKTLTQSDANNGGGFSVPRFCALSIFPELDYNVDPPVQFLSARDVHGVEWKFRHIYRGTPRRHLLTTGWSNFVGAKNLLAGDSIVFVRDEDDKLHVGVRRGNNRVSCGHHGGSGGNVGIRGAAFAGSSDGKVTAEDVIEAARLAAAGQLFEVVHYPRSSAPEFCVRAAAVKESMQAPWCPGLRFKMAFETEDLSRISWFMGTIAGVEPIDRALWPHSPWRLLQVTWDEPELLRNVNRVCPWRVELVSSMPTLPHFSPPPRPCKKPRTESQSECRRLFDPAFPLQLAPRHPAAPNHDWDCRSFIPSFPFPAVPDSTAAGAGIQGTRHPQFTPFFLDLHLSGLQQSLLFRGIRRADHQAPPAPRIATGRPTPDDVKPPGLMLFGRSILTEEKMKSNNFTRSGSSNTSDRSGVTHASPADKDSPSLTLWWSGDSPSSEFGLESGQCKVFVESDAVGRNLDLSVLGSFEELCVRLSSMFGINKVGLISHMVYRTIAGEVKHVGDEPFSAFVKSAQRITILADAGSDNTRNR